MEVEVSEGAAAATELAVEVEIASLAGTCKGHVAVSCDFKTN